VVQSLVGFAHFPIKQAKQLIKDPKMQKEECLLHSSFCAKKVAIILERFVRKLYLSR
jgi:hypothetical protein